MNFVSTAEQEKSFESLDSVKTTLSEVNDSDHALRVDDISNGNNILTVNKENIDSDLRKNSGAVLSVNSSDQV